MAETAYNYKIELSTDNVSWTAVNGLRDFTLPSVNKDSIEVTKHSSALGSKEYIGGLNENESLVFTTDDYPRSYYENLLVSSGNIYVRIKDPNRVGAFDLGGYLVFEDPTYTDANGTYTVTSGNSYQGSEVWTNGTHTFTLSQQSAGAYNSNTSTLNYIFKDSDSNPISTSQNFVGYRTPITADFGSAFNNATLTKTDDKTIISFTGFVEDIEFETSMDDSLLKTITIKPNGQITYN